ncbi:MAG TPA: hypothetical protein VGO50_18085 [Pyrinomonadaceae bacterium]|nr:hypothetical protein [Pyrinomonadaceae bacterium]
MLVSSIAVCAYYSSDRIESIRDSYQNSTAVSKVTAENTDLNSRNVDAEIIKQSEQFKNWAALVLGGIIAILVTSKVYRTPLIEWIYLVLAPSAVFLVYSLYAGWVLGKRYTFLVSLNYYSPTDGLIKLLEGQAGLFLYSIAGVSVFAAWFLCFIVLGKTKPFEVEKKG